MKWPEENLTSNLSNVCRLCMAEGTDCMQKIFAECEHDGERFQLSSRIIAVTSLKMEPGDQLPEQACQHCVAQVNRWYDFKLLCENSDSMLRQQLGHTSSDVEIILQLQVKEEPGDMVTTIPEIADTLTCTTPFVHSDSPIHNLADYSAGEETGTLGRISTTFSLRQDFSTVGESLHPGLLFNGDALSVTSQQTEPITNGFNSLLPFLCTLCEARFSRKTQLKNHIAEHCGEPPHCCNRCDAGFTLKSDLVKHKRTHTPRQLRRVHRPNYMCSVCHCSFKYPQSLLHHQTNHTSSCRLQCLFCSLVCISTVQLRFHLRHHMRHRRTCLKCHRTFTSLNSLHYHNCDLMGIKPSLHISRLS